MSGRMSWREMPVTRSTSRTRSAGTPTVAQRVVDDLFKPSSSANQLNLSFRAFMMDLNALIASIVAQLATVVNGRFCGNMRRGGRWRLLEP